MGQSADRFSVNVLNSWNPVQIERAISIFFQLYRDIRYSLSPRYELELAISRLCWLSEYVSPMEVKRAIDQARNLLLSTPTSVPIPNQNQQFIDPKQRSQGQFSNLMNPTAWKQNANSASPSIQPQPLKPKKPLVVLDALKTLPEYQNAQSVSSSIREREEKEGIPQQNEAQTENGQNVQNVQQPNPVIPNQVPNFQQMQTMQPAQPVQPVQQMQTVMLL